MSKVLFTADTHFSHANIIKYCDRPFADVNEMNEFLIESWNEKVNKDDTVFHLGDVAFGQVPNAVALLRRLNGTIQLIKGNHEKVALDANLSLNRFATVKSYQEVRLAGRNFVLFHYPIASWNRQGHGAIHLHGHCHQTYKHLLTNRIDIGVDGVGYNFSPQTLDEVLELAKQSESLPKPENDGDHHTA